MSKDVTINISSVRNEKAQQQVGNTWIDTGKLSDNRITLAIEGHLTDADALSKLASLTTAQIRAMAQSYADAQDEPTDVNLITPSWVKDTTVWNARVKRDGVHYTHAESPRDKSLVTLINYIVNRPRKSVAFSL